jgi:uncharacterized protein YjbI with pentapeptide repeats
MAKCKHTECTKEALFKSDFCWDHIKDKEKYKKLILRPDRKGEINLVYANLEGAYLVEADLVGAKLVGANLGGANLGGADLRGTKLMVVNLKGTNLLVTNPRVADLRRANLGEANLGGANLIKANLMKSNLTDADLRNANLNEADLTEATLTGSKVWGMSHAGCKTDGIKAEYLNFDKDGKDSGIVHLNKEQVEEFFSLQPTIEILLQNKLPPYAIRTLLDLIDKINQENPSWGVELKRIALSSFFSELILKANKDDVLEKLAKVFLLSFNRTLKQKLLEYRPDKKAATESPQIVVQQATMIFSSGAVENVNLKGVKMRDFKISGKNVKIGKIININVGRDLYQISTRRGREDLIRNLIDQLDSPEIEKRIKEAEAQLKGLSTEQVKFLEEEFRESGEKIFKEKQKEVGFLDKVKAFSQRFSESSFAGVIGNAIWYFIHKFALPNM